MNTTWTEDRATQECDPSADPEAKTEGWAVVHAAARPSSFGIGTKAQNSRGTMPRLPRQDALHESLTPTCQDSNSR
jgi:hypothetical protein